MDIDKLKKVVLRPFTLENHVKDYAATFLLHYNLFTEKHTSRRAKEIFLKNHYNSKFNNTFDRDCSLFFHVYDYKIGLFIYETYRIMYNNKDDEAYMIKHYILEYLQSRGIEEEEYTSLL